MLGAVAIGYFIAAAFAMAVACSGPDARAKFCSAYLLGAWAFSNVIFKSFPPDDALAEFSFWDLTAVLVIYVVMIRWPTRWIALLLAALSTQVIFQLYHRFGAPQDRSTVAAFAVNEAMYCLQLLAVTIPTWAQVVRRLRKRRPARGRIPPPYDGWEPPIDYREVGGGEAR